MALQMELLQESYYTIDGTIVGKLWHYKWNYCRKVMALQMELLQESYGIINGTIVGKLWHYKWNYCRKVMALQMELSHLPQKFEHIFVAVITFPPFFCADTFDTSLLLIVCALICEMSLQAPFLKRYIQTRKVTKKIAPPKLEHL